jgi:hypothetical protein
MSQMFTLNDKWSIEYDVAEKKNKEWRAIDYVVYVESSFRMYRRVVSLTTRTTTSKEIKKWDSIFDF